MTWQLINQPTIHSINTTFIHSFNNSFIHSFIHILIYLFRYSFIHSCIHLFIHVFINSIIYLFICSGIVVFAYIAYSVQHWRQLTLLRKTSIKKIFRPFFFMLNIKIAREPTKPLNIKIRTFSLYWIKIKFSERLGHGIKWANGLFIYI